MAEDWPPLGPTDKKLTALIGDQQRFNLRVLTALAEIGSDGQPKHETLEELGVILAGMLMKELELVKAMQGQADERG